MWIIGKPPDIVIEIVSDSRGGEDTTKLQHYATIGVPYYVIFDPKSVLSNQPLRVFAKERRAYVQTNTSAINVFGLGLTPAFADVTLRYLASQGGLSAYELAAELDGEALAELGYLPEEIARTAPCGAAKFSRSVAPVNIARVKWAERE